MERPQALPIVRWLPWQRFGLNAALTVAVALPLSLAAITGNALTTARLMGADSLWTLAFVRDILSSGGRLADWNLAQHADLFPDKLIAALAYLISSRPETWLLAFEALNFALYFAVAWYCFRLVARAAGSKATTGALALWAAIFVTALPPFLRSWGIFGNYLQYLGGPAHHFGAYFCAVLSAFIAIDCFAKPITRGFGLRLGAASLLILLCGLSDKLSIAIAIPGLLVAAAYIAARRRNLSRSLILSCGAMCAAAAIAYSAGDFLWNRIVEIAPAEPHFGITRIEQQIRYLLLSLLTRPAPTMALASTGVILPLQHHWIGIADLIRQLDPVQTAISAAGIVVVLGFAGAYFAETALALGRRLRPPVEEATADSFIVYLVASALLLPAALMAAGVLYSQGVELYVYPAAYCVLWAATAKLCVRFAPALSPLQAARGAVATGLLLSAMPLDFARPPFARAPEPPLVRCLEEFGKSRDLRLGLGAHWDSYPVEFATQGRIVVRAIVGDAEISHWVDSYAWYAPPADGRLYTFVIDGDEIDAEGLRQAIGAPAEVLDCAGLGSGFSKRKIFFYDRAAAARLTTRMADQYRRSDHR
jgi:hypothetical protein